MQPAFPFQIDHRGRTAVATREDYVRQLIEQVLFTRPGERVNRADFGCGLQELVFGTQGSDLFVATQSLIQGALHRWMGDWIEVESVQVTADDATLRIVVQYILKETGERQQGEFNTRGAE